MRHIPSAVFAAALIFTGRHAAAEDLLPDPIYLWPNGAPGAIGDEPVDKPRVHLYPAPKETANGAAVVVCPGGGYGHLAVDHEGDQIGKYFQSLGVTAAALKYRLGKRYQHPAPMNDVQRAIRYVRHNAKELAIDPHRIGVMGFSAGGHLASTAATHFNEAITSGDPIDQESARPDFAILCYPVITMENDFTHKGSVRNLLGPDPDPKLLHSMSNETQVTSETPPTFLFHTTEDQAVPVENSIQFYRALVKAKVRPKCTFTRKADMALAFAPVTRSSPHGRSGSPTG